MTFKIWAYLFASIGVILGGISMKNKKWKIGAWIICFSLLVFVGDHVKIGDISPSITDSFNIMKKEVDDVKSDLKALKVDINQAIALKQEVSQTVNVITKVQKEIANIKEATQQIYSQTKGEMFYENNLGDTVKIFEQGKKMRVIYFQLKNSPISNSVEVTNQNGTASPATFVVFHNIICLRTNEKMDKILKEDVDFYHIKYYQDYLSEESFYTLKDMVYKGTPDNPNIATFNKLIKEETD